MQWKKVNKSGRSTPGAMVMVGAGHVSAQCQETQPLHFPCIALHCICIALLSVKRPSNLYTHVRAQLYTSLPLYCIVQCQSRNLYTRAKPYTSLSQLPLHCIVFLSGRSEKIRSCTFQLYSIACQRLQYTLLPNNPMQCFESNVLVHCEEEAAWVAAAPNIRFR